MISSTKCRPLLQRLFRGHSTKSKLKVIPAESMLDDINNEAYKPRNHPGILKPRSVQLPDALLKAVETVLEDYPVKLLIEQSTELVNHLRYKMPPIERQEVRKATYEIKERVLSNPKLQNFEINNEQDKIKFENTVKNKVANIVKKEIYNWKQVNYDAHNSLVYLIARLAPEYAVLVRIFAEIAARDPAFKPRSLFDFGSGIGTATWAANAYWKNIFEYFNVDSSADMNDLAQILLQGGKGTKQMPLKGVFYRQFLPASNTSYDLVVSAYSLLELPSYQSRLETVLNLWNKTQKYLVIVEQGSNSGFKIVNEARDFILHTKNTRSVGHVFSPCPHDEICPRFVLNDGTPCNFQIRYLSLPVGMVSETRSERYCYVVIKKGERPSSDPQWPRVIRENLVRSKHTICSMCTKSGNIEKVIFTASKHGKTMYHCARSTKWGDLLPIELNKTEDKEDACDNSKETS